jgi:hypothetical protein
MNGPDHNAPLSIPALTMNLKDWLGLERKALVGFAHRFRPTYAGANMGHPYGLVAPRQA